MDERRSSRTVLIAVIVVVLLVLPGLYFASIGPLVHFVESSGATEESPFVHVVGLYMLPAGLLVESGCGDWLMDYVDWWDA